MLILIRTLQITGWFEGDQSKNSAAYLRSTYAGKYLLKKTLERKSSFQTVEVLNSTAEKDAHWLNIKLDTIPHYKVRVSDFEDDQVLVELYEIDSTGNPQRLEGCELLLVENESGQYSGNTIGDFCGLKIDSPEYLVLELSLNDSTALLQLESYRKNDTSAIGREKYLLERLDTK